MSRQLCACMYQRGGGGMTWIAGGGGDPGLSPKRPDDAARRAPPENRRSAREQVRVRRSLTLCDRVRHSARVALRGHLGAGCFRSV